MIKPENTKKNDPFQITLPKFEGPLDLLLFLIRKKEVNIFDIPIATILNDYLYYLSIMESMDINVTSEFLVLAATLAHIKSRLLLRNDTELTDGEESPEAELQKLTEQLLEYEKYKNVAAYFEQTVTLDQTAFKHPAHATLPEDIQSLGSRLDISLYDLVSAFNSVLSKKPDQKSMLLDHDRFSIKEGIEKITRLFKEKNRIAFEFLFEGAENKTDCIVLFLSLLEMVKLGLSRIIRLEESDPIFIEATDNLNLTDD